MRDVYRNAVFCIAATAAENGNDGLFYDRDVQLSTSVNIEIRDPFEPSPFPYQCSFGMTDPAVDIDQAPLNRRAWVAQERYLSSRILHFTRQALYWECTETFGSEVFSDGIPRSAFDHFDRVNRAVRSLKELVTDRRLARLPSDDGDEKVYSAWRDFVAFYTTTGLTYEMDLIVALRGIASDIGEEMEDEMVAGMWRGRWVDELCWSIVEPDPSKPFRPSSWRAPSWSWASVTVPIQALGLRPSPSRHKYAEVVDVEVAENSVGQMVQAVLVLKCRLIPWKFHAINIEMRRDEPAPVDEDEREYYLILLRSDVYRKKGIVVEYCDGKPGYLRRVAFASGQKEEFGDLLDVYKTLEYQAVKLV
jgi:hypothetical protein